MKKNPIKILYIGLAFFFLVLGMIGVVLPILPTTPFLLLTAFFFAKGSERFYNWFVATKIYKKHLESFVTDRAMTLKTKLCILLPATCMLMFPFFMMNNIPGKAFIVFLIIFKYAYFFTQIRTIKPGDENSSTALKGGTAND